MTDQTDGLEEQKLPQETEASSAKNRLFGSLREIISAGPEFFVPLSEEEMAGWE